MEYHPNTEVRPTHPKTLGTYIPGPNTHSALPPEVSKARAIGIVCTALQVMGLHRSAITAWRFIADQTESKAWVSTHETPMNFRKAKDLAREHGISDRHWRRIEAQLEQAGVLARATSDNGFRGKICKGRIVFGLSIEPALANFATLQELASQPERDDLERKRCLGQIRSLRQRLKKYDAFAPLGPELHRIWEQIEVMHRPTRPGYASLNTLETYLQALLEFEARIRQWFEMDTGDNHPKLTAAPAEITPASSEETVHLSPDIQTLQSGGNSTKMSAPADSHVRLQCNLEYKNKPLNACAKHKEEIQNRISISLTPDLNITKKSNETDNIQPLKNNHLLNLGLIDRLHDFSQLLDDINRVKSGTECEKLDPQHIWKRFKRYNLRRDKQILPVAALRGFIKGWIPNQQVSYVEQTKHPVEQVVLDPEHIKQLQANSAIRKAKNLEADLKNQLALAAKASKEIQLQSSGLKLFKQQSPSAQRQFLIDLAETSAVLSIAAIRKRWKEINYDVTYLDAQSKTDHLILSEIASGYLMRSTV